MKKVLIPLVASVSLLASNYRIVPLSSDGVALSGSNLAKSFGADAAFLNPANMAFLQARPQVHFALNYYGIRGSKFINELTEVNGKRYYNAEDANGRNYAVALPVFAFVYPVNEKHFLGAAAYTDFAAVYGWDSDYASSLANNMNIRGGTVALSYAYRPISELSLGVALTANHTKLKFDLIKDNVKNPDYPRPALPNEPTWTDDEGKTHPYFWAYDGKTKTDNGLKLGYKLSLTYAPSYFDEKLRFSAFYNSSYENDFKGDMHFKLSKWDMFDFAEKVILANTQTGSLADLLNPQMIGLGLGYATLGVEMKEAVANNALYDLPIKYDGSISANFLYPASINLGVAYELGKHEFMLNVGRTFWSKNEKLNLKVDTPKTPNKLQTGVIEAIGKIQQALPTCSVNDTCKTEVNKILAGIAMTMTPEEKQEIQEYFLAEILNQSLEQKWKDTTLISLGYRYNYDEKWSFMGGFATEDSPVSRQRISFLAKDSRIYMYSLGCEYRYSSNFTINTGAMYQQYADVSVHDVDNELLWTSGHFKDQKNYIFNLGFNYIF